MFQNSVRTVSIDFLLSASTDPDFQTFIKSNLETEKFYLKIYYLQDGNVRDECSLYCCNTCYSSLKKGKVPRVAALNGLKLLQIPKEFSSMTYLEQSLVAKIANFSEDFSFKTFKNASHQGQTDNGST